MLIGRKKHPRSTSKRFSGARVPAVVALAFFMAFCSILAGCTEEKNRPLTIGVPDDAGGLIPRYLAEERKDLRLSGGIDPYPIKDCCTSTSEWALSSSRVDMAVVCPDAAQRLVEKDKRYVVVGPCLVNSDLILLRTEEKPESIGITQNRWYQEDLVKRRLGENVRVVPMLGAALPYALTKGAVDGIVIDVLKGAHLEGEKRSIAPAGHEQVTYVLVARRDVMATRAFKDLMASWEKAARRLNEPQELEKWLRDCGISDSSEEVVIWKDMGTRFTLPRIR